MRISEFLEGNKNCNGTITALLTKCEEAIAKNGKPFIKGVLVDNEELLPFKMWDVDLAGFKKFVPNAGDRPVLITAEGSFELYEGSGQFIAKGKISFTDEEEAILPFVAHATYPVGDMLNVLDHIISSVVKTEELAELCVKTMNVPNLCYAPFSPSCHYEKGGYLAHIYNVISMVYNLYGEPKKMVEVERDGKMVPKYVPIADKEVVITALLYADFSNLFIYQAEPVTGSIIDTNKAKNRLVGSELQSVLYFDMASAAVKESASPGLKRRIAMVSHCISCARGLVEPCSLEAAMVKGVRALELSMDAVSRATGQIGVDEEIRYFDPVSNTHNWAFRSW